jgi:hypothetical protein
MGTADEIQGLRQKGMTDGEIIGTLKSRGIPESEIVNSLSQSKIKDAVSAPSSPADAGSFSQQGQGGVQFGGSQQQQAQPGLGQGFGDSQNQGGMPPSPNSPPMMQQQPGGGQQGNSGQQGGMQTGSGEVQPGGMQSGGMTQEGFTPPAMQQDQYGSGDYAGMQPSMMTPGGGDYAGGAGFNQGGGDYAGGGAEEYVPGPGGGAESGGDYAYDQYQPYQEAMSTEVISEIAEQIVNEKLSYLKDRLEGVLDIRTVVDARMTNLNERLRRIEKIMDQLQLSVLQKVGEYVNDVKDLKKEMEETQKTFSAVHKGKHKSKK